MKISAIHCFISLAIAFAATAVIANAQCPALGYDSTCGTVITITDAGASVSFTGQGPYEGSDDTLVGVINNSRIPVTSIVVTSGNNIFGFDGDGIIQYGAPGNPMDSTGYGGPNAYFTNISGDQQTGTVNFITAIAAHGGTAYFGLENALTSATACTDLINNSVTQSLTGPFQTGIAATFTPNNGYTLTQAAQLCGFTAWNWQQTITEAPLPSPVYAVGNPNPVHAPPPFNDPPPQGYTYQTPPNAVQLPVYYNLFTANSDPLSLAANETATTLSFFDAPADPCLPGGSGAHCGGKTAPAGSKLAFTTHLVGIVGALPGAGVLDTGIGFSWIDTFNGTSGGIAVLNAYLPVDPGSGTGGITITNVNGTTSYHYPKTVGVVAVNGKTVTTPPLTLLTASQVSATSTGLGYSRVTHSFYTTLKVTNISSATISAPLQVVLDSLPSSVTLVNASSTFGGFPYVTIPGVSSLAPGQSVTETIEFKDPSNTRIYFEPLVYSGSFD